MTLPILARVWLVCAVCCCAVDALTPPKFAPNFKSDLSQAVVDVSNHTGVLFYSNEQGATRYDMTMKVPSSDITIPEVLITNGDGQVLVSNTVCRPIPGEFNDWFAFLPYSRYMGETEKLGHQCAEWRLLVPRSSHNSVGMDLIMYSYTDPVLGDVPVQLLQTFNFSDGSSVSMQNNFHNYKPVQSFPVSFFVFPPECSHDFLCGNGAIETTNTYRFHPPKEFSLENHNTGDPAGDTAFVCAALLSGTHSYDQWISQFVIELNTTYGQYGLCNGGFCISYNQWQVGRECAYGLKPFGGQCANNSDVGNWYSFPAASHCEDDGPVGVNNCQWRVIRRVKTIDATCLESNDFTAACRKDGGFPYTTASALFVKAFENDDPAENGCPPIYPSDRENTPLRAHSSPLSYDQDRNIAATSWILVSRLRALQAKLTQQ
mmetsp:Transcript_8210/g.25421  ORF Transcript_8210/g.25421 Transcript_8210/m.25421 type:complete len:432 (+) Transcript_8210:43-1338(+)|eukprot:CAMPEP_0174229552 /NCGR_PEP_ID=MMETSP0417-20130205/491_1 /TAXON_ID=242541 /ORGANISM="Mayorella sp, Strain BSH-02190019" /LENGTH=431 /DNA_ID=CAMNT_0015307113 /DNA_START=1 /DNA_END=1296 /DNA_ORIENTATION=+